ncbi:MAG: hypothetical protein AAGK71_05145, partial [Pseudomonadota bacterium]
QNNSTEPTGVLGEIQLAAHPSTHFFRKRATLKVTWLGTQTAEELKGLYLGTLTQGLFHVAAVELAAALSWAFRSKLKKTDDFDADACVKWVQGAANAKFDSDPQLREILGERTRQKLTRHRKAKLDQEIDIDWNRFDPNASYTLGEAFLWSEADERSPHGSAVGSEILRNWSAYRDVNIERAYKQTGLPDWSPDGSAAERENAVRAYLGIAIGHVKHSARCPRDIAQKTLDVIEKERKSPGSVWERGYKGMKVSALERYIPILESFAQDDSED